MDTYKVLTQNGKEIEIKILFVFNLNGIDYVIYTDNEDILASRYDKQEERIVLKNIETDFEWNIVEKEISKRLGD